MKLAGQHALITGGGTGIGAAIAHALAEEGARLTLVGRRREPLERIAGELEGSSVATADVTDRRQVDAAVAAARSVHIGSTRCGRASATRSARPAARIEFT